MKIYLLNYENTEKFPECRIMPNDPWNEERWGTGIEIVKNIHYQLKCK